MSGSSATVFDVPEAVGFADAAQIRRAGEAFVDTGPQVLDFNLGGVRSSSSMLAALLLAWLRHARVRGKQVRFLDAPTDLRNIIELYGVTGILPLAGVAGDGMKEFYGDGSRSHYHPGSAPGPELA